MSSSKDEEVVGAALTVFWSLTTICEATKTAPYPVPNPLLHQGMTCRSKPLPKAYYCLRIEF